MSTPALVLYLSSFFYSCLPLLGHQLEDFLWTQYTMNRHLLLFGHIFHKQTKFT